MGSGYTYAGRVGAIALISNSALTDDPAVGVAGKCNVSSRVRQLCDRVGSIVAGQCRHVCLRAPPRGIDRRQEAYGVSSGLMFAAPLESRISF